MNLAPEAFAVERGIVGAVWDTEPTSEIDESDVGERWRRLDQYGNRLPEILDVEDAAPDVLMEPDKLEAVPIEDLPDLTGVVDWNPKFGEAARGDDLRMLACGDLRDEADAHLRARAFEAVLRLPSTTTGGDERP